MRDHPHTPISQHDKIGEVPKQQISASLEDPEELRKFMRSVHEILRPRLMHELDEEIKTEVVNFNRLILMASPRILELYRPQIELVAQVIAESPSDIKIIQGLRVNLGSAIARHQYGLIWIFRYIAGTTPLTAVVSALLSMFVLLCIATVSIVQLHAIGSNLPKEIYETYNIILMIRDAPINSIMIVTHSAFIGSIVSIITRVNKYLFAVPFSPLLTYLSVLTRPLIAVSFAIFVFAVIKAGVISSLEPDLSGATGSYFLYAVSFLCGFSERFAKDIMVRAGGPLDGKAEEQRSSSSRE